MSIWNTRPNHHLAEKYRNAQNIGTTEQTAENRNFVNYVDGNGNRYQGFVNDSDYQKAWQDYQSGGGSWAGSKAGR